jgi:hypothetical protein
MPPMAIARIATPTIPAAMVISKLIMQQPRDAPIAPEASSDERKERVS